MTKPARPSSPPPPGTAQELESQVQRRAQSTPATAARPTLSSAPVELSPRERLEAKLRLGRSLLSQLPPSDARGRLLSVALMRRDEALLDGVLAAITRNGI